MDVTKTSGVIETYASLSGTLSTQITEVIETADYDQLQNLPTINGVLLKGDMTSEDLGIERGYDAQVDEEDEEHLILTT
jgi:hypothetical protein